MKTRALVTAAITLGFAYPVLGEPVMEDHVELAVPAATAFSGDGKPRFRADQAFLLTLAANPEGRVLQYDANHRMVRISAPQAEALWLRCSELKPMRVACSETEATRTSPRYRTRGSGTATMAPTGMVPFCPGDPRCPQLK